MLFIYKLYFIVVSFAYTILLRFFNHLKLINLSNGFSTSIVVVTLWSFLVILITKIIKLINLCTLNQTYIPLVILYNNLNVLLNFVWWDQSWVFIGETDIEAETPILWPPDVESWLICKDPDAGKDWGQEEKGMTEDEMVGWHHWHNEHGFGWTPGFGNGQGGLACCGSWGRKESDMTEQLKWTELNWIFLL